MLTLITQLMLECRSEQTHELSHACLPCSSRDTDHNHDTVSSAIECQ